MPERKQLDDCTNSGVRIKEKLAEAIKDFSAEDLRDLLAFVRALKSGVVKSSSE